MRCCSRNEDNFGGSTPRKRSGEDGYRLEVAEAGDRVRVTIIVTPEACADCLVPKDLMRGILGQTLGVPEDAIDLTYPSTSPKEI